MNIYNREDIEKYKGWVIEDRGSNAAYEWYAIRNPLNNNIKKVVVEDGLGEVYNYFDTVGNPPSRTLIKEFQRLNPLTK